MFLNTRCRFGARGVTALAAQSEGGGVKPAPFAYVNADSLDQVCDLLRRHGGNARILAGGQSLIATLNMRLSAPELVIDINRIDGLAGIKVADGLVRIGALTRLAELESSTEIARHLPLITAAMPHIGHPAIRNRGTFGGSIAFADPAAELPACARALGGRFVLHGPDGTRTVDADDFFLGLYETSLAPDEVLVAAEFETPEDGYRSAFAELSRRHGDFAVIGLAAHGKVANGVFSDLRLVFFSAGDRPILARTAAAAIEGQAFSPQTAKAVQDSLSQDLDPPGDLNGSPATKLHLARVLAGRILAELAAASG